MEPQVSFYRLDKKIVQNQERIPDRSRQILYYSLAIGHHVGVMDCFSVFLEIPVERYRRLLVHLPQGPGRIKLEGVLKWGEIEINRDHVRDLVSVLTVALPALDEIETGWANTLVGWLQKIVDEPALYLMVKRSR